MKIKEQYNEFCKNPIDRDGRPCSKESIITLKKLLCGARLMNKELEYVRDNPKKVHQELRMQLLGYFDEREALISCVNTFFDSFEVDWRGGRNETNFCQTDKLYDASELKVKLLKYLQSGDDETKKLHRQDIAEHFNMSVNALDTHLNALKSGECRIIGTNVKIEQRWGLNTYNSTIHPTFMALNLTEVYLLTVVLPLLTRNTHYAKIAGNIASAVFTQLSPYAKDKISPYSKRNAITYEKVTEYRKESHDIPFYEKCGELCEVTYSGCDECLVGRFEFGKEISFVTEDGQRYHLENEKILDIALHSDQSPS